MYNLLKIHNMQVRVIECFFFGIYLTEDCFLYLLRLNILLGNLTLLSTLFEEK